MQNETLKTPGKRNLTMKTIRTLPLFAFLLALLAQNGAEAQYQVQSIELEPGWNAIHLELDPVNTSTAGFLALHEGKIEAVWSYDNRFGAERAFRPIEFNEDIEVPPTRVKNHWRVYHPDHREIANLFHLRGGRAYLLKVRAGEEPFTTQILGRPVADDGGWVSHGYSMRGFSIDRGRGEEELPTFADYFSGSEVHLAAGSRVFKMGLDGRMQGPLDKNTTRILPGRSYWFFTDGVSEYRGPVDIRGLDREGIDFGRTSVEKTLELRNNTRAPRTVLLSLKSTLDRAPAGSPARAGNVRLSYLRVENGQRSWQELTDRAVPFTIAPNTSRNLQLRARRQGLPVAIVRELPARAGEGGGAGLDAGENFQGELEIETEEGIQHRIAIELEVPSPPGLWIGEVRLRYARKIDREAPTGGTEPLQLGDFNPATEVEPDGATSTYTGVPSDFPKIAEGTDDTKEFSFPVILFIGGSGADNDVAPYTLKLLRQVALMWRETETADGLTNPGRYVLVTRDGLKWRGTDDQNIIQEIGLVGGMVKDGRRFSYLKSAPNFHADLPLSSAEEFPSGTWGGEFNISATHPLNPYYHRYHPDHGNKKIVKGTGSIEPSGGMDIDRWISLSFSENDPSGADRPSYGDTLLSGTYREVIGYWSDATASPNKAPLLYDPVVVQGTFEVRKAIGGIGVLNDGIAEINNPD